MEERDGMEHDLIGKQTSNQLSPKYFTCFNAGLMIACNARFGIGAASSDIEWSDEFCAIFFRRSLTPRPSNSTKSTFNPIQSRTKKRHN